MANGPVQISVDPRVYEGVERIEAKLVELEDKLEAIERQLQQMRPRLDQIINRLL